MLMVGAITAEIETTPETSRRQLELRAPCHIARQKPNAHIVIRSEGIQQLRDAREHRHGILGEASLKVAQVPTEEPLEPP